MAAGQRGQGAAHVRQLRDGEDHPWHVRDPFRHTRLGREGGEVLQHGRDEPERRRGEEKAFRLSRRHRHREPPHGVWQQACRLRRDHGQRREERQHRHRLHQPEQARADRAVRRPGDRPHPIDHACHPIQR